MPKPTPTLDQTIALSQIGKAYDRFGKVIRRALALGVSPERIIEFLDDPATQITNHVMRQIIRDEVIVHTENADTEDQPAIEDADTLVIKETDERQ